SSHCSMLMFCSGSVLIFFSILFVVYSKHSLQCSVPPNSRAAVEVWRTRKHVPHVNSSDWAGVMVPMPRLASSVMAVGSRCSFQLILFSILFVADMTSLQHVTSRVKFSRSSAHSMCRSRQRCAYILVSVRLVCLALRRCTGQARTA